MSKGKKKYNPKKYIFNHLNFIAHEQVSVYVQGIKQTLSYNRTNKIISHQISKDLHQSLVTGHFDWHITMAVLGKNTLGSEMIVWDELSCNVPMQQHVLADLLTECHKEILDDADCKLMVGTPRFAWIACPSDNVLSDDEMYEIFKRLRGFEEDIFPNQKNK